MSNCFDATYATKLEERTEYELFTLEFFRQRLFGHSEISTDVYSLTLGEEGGHNQSVAYISSGAEAVRKALDYFRPLAFISTFKLQDMIVEWILEANGFLNWRFKKKIEEYIRLRDIGILVLPPFFQARPDLAEAFWELYCKLEPPRGTVVHSPFKIEPDGTLKIKDRNNTETMFDDHNQAAYVRSICLITKALLCRVDELTYYSWLIERDLSALHGFHGRPVLVSGAIRYEAARVYVPQNFAEELTPYAVTFDVNKIRSRMEQCFPTAPNGKLLFSLEIIAETKERQLIWSLPAEKVPDGVRCIREDDTELSRYLTIRTVQPKTGNQP